MWPFRKRTKPSPSQGMLGYLNLMDRWHETFTEDERRYIEATYKPFKIALYNGFC